MAKRKEDIDLVVWTRSRLLTDIRLALIIICIGVIVVLTVRTFFTPN